MKTSDLSQSFSLLAVRKGFNFRVLLAVLVMMSTLSVSAQNRRNVRGKRPVRTTQRAVSKPVAVDLGLPSGTKWADRNIGASSPSGYGLYTGGNFYYSQINYDSNVYEDAAHYKWGGKWREPTGEQLKELVDNCKAEWTTMNGVNGCKFTGPNGNSIFLPAAGTAPNTTYNGYENKGRNGIKVEERGRIGTYWASEMGVSYEDALEFFQGALDDYSEESVLESAEGSNLGYSLYFEKSGVVVVATPFDVPNGAGAPIRPVIVE